MANDAHSGAENTRAVPGSRPNGASKDGQSASGSARGSSRLNLTRFWDKGGSPFDAKAPASNAASGKAASGSLHTSTGEVPTFSWATANRPIAVGIGLSLVWLAVFAFYVTRTLGWSELFLLLPPEFGGLFAVGLMPLAFLWLLIAFVDRGRQFSQEGRALREHLARLTYPADDAAGNVEAVTASLQRQVDALTEASEAVSVRLTDLQAQLVRSTDK